MKTALAFVLALVAAPALAQGGGGVPHFIENWDGDADGAVTLAEATSRRGDIFLTFDADEDGRLSVEEYALFDEARAQDQAQVRQGKAEGAGQLRRENAGMERAFNDLDGDGFVSREEFLARTPDWYAQMDRNGDGTVTRDDFGRGN